MTTQLRVKTTRRVWTRVAFLIGGTIAMSETPMEARSEIAIGGTPAAQANSGTAAVIRRFRVHFPDEALADLKRRIAATRWPERETVTDRSQGVQLAKIPTSTWSTRAVTSRRGNSRSCSPRSFGQRTGRFGDLGRNRTHDESSPDLARCDPRTPPGRSASSSASIGESRYAWTY